MGRIHPMHAASYDAKEIIDHCVSVLMESNLSDQYKDPEFLTKYATDQYNTIMPLFAYNQDAIQTDCVSVDFPDAASLEDVLNKGGSAEGKTACIKVQKVNFDYFWGVNVWAGEHLNMLSKEDFELKEGQNVTVRVLKYAKFNYSWFITYAIVRVAANGTAASRPETIRHNNSRKEGNQKMASENAVILAKIVGKLEKFRDQLEEVRENEQEIFDEMSEKQQESKNGEALQEKIENLDTAYSDLDDAINVLEEYTEGVSYDDEEVETQSVSVDTSGVSFADKAKELKKNIRIVKETFDDYDIEVLNIGCRAFSDKDADVVVLVEISRKSKEEMDTNLNLKVNLYDKDKELYLTGEKFVPYTFTGFDTISIECKDHKNALKTAFTGKVYVSQA